MKSISVATSVLSFCAIVSAQSTTVSPDPLFALAEGTNFCTTFGGYADGRFQFADGNHRGSSMNVKELCFRHDHRNYDVSNGMGRDWSKVIVQMSECDLTTFGTTFTKNPTSTPSTMFNKAVSWPVQLGPSEFLPAPWSIAFPFTSVWSYTGNKDILADVWFTGGTLDNTASWSGSALRPYYLDSFHTGSFATGQSVSIGHVNGGCVDSSANAPYGASVQFDTAAYGPLMSSTTFRNKYFVQASGRGFAPSAPAIIAMAFRADLTGIPVGVPCNRVHLHIANKWFLYPQLADANGIVPAFAFGLPAGLAPYTPAWAGFNLVVQGVWADSKTAALKLSNASRNSFVPVPLATPADVKLMTAYDWNASSSVASFFANGVGSAIPILCYRN